MIDDMQVLQPKSYYQLNQMNNIFLKLNKYIQFRKKTNEDEDAKRMCYKSINEIKNTPLMMKRDDLEFHNSREVNRTSEIHNHLCANRQRANQLKLRFNQVFIFLHRTNDDPYDLQAIVGGAIYSTTIKDSPVSRNRIERMKSATPGSGFEVVDMPSELPKAVVLVDSQEVGIRLFHMLMCGASARQRKLPNNHW